MHTGSYSDADIRSFKSRGIINSISRHTYHMSPVLQSTYDVQLVSFVRQLCGFRKKEQKNKRHDRKLENVKNMTRGEVGKDNEQQE